MNADKLFIVDGPTCGYGQTNYCLVYAKTLIEARAKANAKYPLYVEAEVDAYGDNSMPDSEIVFDENGISQILAHPW